MKALKETFGAEPRALSDVLLLAPADKLDERKQEYPDIEVRPLKFGAAELQTSHWRFLMGAVGNQATYIRQLNRVMKSLRDELTLEGLNQGIEASSLPDHLKGMAKMRLELASEYIDDSVRLKDEIRPGRLIIVDLRDEFIEKDEALGLFVVLLQLFADAKHRDAAGVEHSFNKLVVFDEAHKYIESPDLVAGLIEVVREICDLVDGPVSAEVTATDHATMLSEGRKLAQIARNVAVKVPLTPDGLKTCKALRSEGIMVNVTLCFSAGQALLAAKADASFISPFIGRIDDNGHDGMGLITEIMTIYRQYPHFKTEVLAAWSARGQDR